MRRFLVAVLAVATVGMTGLAGLDDFYHGGATPQATRQAGISPDASMVEYSIPVPQRVA